MAFIPSGNADLDRIRSNYTDEQKKKTEKKNDALGRDAFLTMLVAQMQNQDPLSPMEGADFSAQLAQFSQLEQLMDLNDSMEKMAGDGAAASGKDPMGYLGSKVTGNVDTLTVEEGMSTSGTYSLTGTADVKIVITDEDGKTVRTLYQGQKSEGTETFSWDARDMDEKLVADGKYKYTVMANFGNGYVQIPSTVSGTVDSVVYRDNKAYLLVEGTMIEPSSILSVEKAPSEVQETNTPKNIMDYLGKRVTIAHPQIQVENGEVMGNEIGFHLDRPEPVIINIYDGTPRVVRTIQLTAEETASGDNTLEWDGIGNNQHHVPDGLYTYTIQNSESSINTDLTGQVSGLKNLDGVQYLILDSQRLAHLGNIKEIHLP